MAAETAYEAQLESRIPQILSVLRGLSIDPTEQFPSNAYPLILTREAQQSPKQRFGLLACTKDCVYFLAYSPSENPEANTLLLRLGANAATEVAVTAYDTLGIDMGSQNDLRNFTQKVDAHFKETFKKVPAPDISTLGRRKLKADLDHLIVNALPLFSANRKRVSRLKNLSRILNQWQILTSFESLPPAKQMLARRYNGRIHADPTLFRFGISDADFSLLLYPGAPAEPVEVEQDEDEPVDLSTLKLPEVGLFVVDGDGKYAEDNNGKEITVNMMLQDPGILKWIEDYVISIKRDRWIVPPERRQVTPNFQGQYPEDDFLL